MISFCEQILLMLNVLMISYLLFNKEFNKHHCVKGIICFLASLVVIVLKKEINPSIINIVFMFLAYIFIFDLSLESIKEFISSYIVMVFLSNMYQFVLVILRYQSLIIHQCTCVIDSYNSPLFYHKAKSFNH